MVDWFKQYFEELLLAALFLATVVLAIYLIKKADAGGDDMTFIVWAETQAAMILGALLNKIKGGSADTSTK